MQHFMAATGISCAIVTSATRRPASSRDFDTQRSKQTARQDSDGEDRQRLLPLVCASTARRHQGRNQPAGCSPHSRHPIRSQRSPSRRTTSGCARWRPPQGAPGGGGSNNALTAPPLDEIHRQYVTALAARRRSRDQLDRDHGHPRQSRQSVRRIHDRAEGREVSREHGGAQATTWGRRDERSVRADCWSPTSRLPAAQAIKLNDLGRAGTEDAHTTLRARV